MQFQAVFCGKRLHEASHSGGEERRALLAPRSSLLAPRSSLLAHRPPTWRRLVKPYAVVIAQQRVLRLERIPAASVCISLLWKAPSRGVAFGGRRAKGAPRSSLLAPRSSLLAPRPSPSDVAPSRETIRRRDCTTEGIAPRTNPGGERMYQAFFSTRRWVYRLSLL